MAQFTEAVVHDQKVDNHWKRIDFRETYVSRRPLVLAAMQTFAGSNTASLRMKGLNRHKFKVQVEEEQTGDVETRHVPEQIGYFTIDWPGEIWDEGRDNLVGVAGLEKIDQPDPDMDIWYRIDLPDHFKNPVVFAQVLSHHGGQPVHPRLAAVNHAIRHVRDASFFYQLEEWGEDTHKSEWVSWLAIDIGNGNDNAAEYRLDGFSDYKVVVGEVPCSHEWKTVSLPSFRSAPVVVTQCQSFIGPHPVVTRQDVDGSSFKVRLQEAEGSDVWHTTESVGYIAVEPSH